MTCWEESHTAQVFNIRKMGKETYPITSADSLIQGASFDHSGNYLVTGVGSGLQILTGRKWDETVVSIPDAHQDIVNVAKFAPSGTFIVSASDGKNDGRFIKVFGI